MEQGQENRGFFTHSRYCVNNDKCPDSVHTRGARAVLTREIHGNSIRSRCEVLSLLTMLWGGTQVSDSGEGTQILGLWGF